MASIAHFLNVQYSLRTHGPHLTLKGAALSEFRDFVYIRTDPVPMDADPSISRKLWASDLAKTRAHLKKARRQGFSAHRRDAVTERVSAAVAASGRPKFDKLLRKLGPDTGLIVWTLDGLGRDAADVLKTIRTVKARRAEIYCMDICEDELPDDRKFMATLQVLAELDRMTGKLRSVADGLGRGVAGGRVGRPPSLDAATQAKVRADLAAGDSISDLARRYNTSRQTVLRVRDAGG